MTALKIVKGAFDSGRKDYINHAAASEPRIGVLFYDFVEMTIKRKARRMKPSYEKNYKSLLFHLRNFTEEYGVNIYTNSVNEEFLDDFISYLEEKDLTSGYIHYLLVLVKGMVKKAAVYGYAVDSSYDDVEVKTTDSFSVYLSMNEISRLYFYQGLTRIQEKWRDLFIVGCLTAFRYSDYSDLSESNFDEKFITKVTKKTGIKVVIPQHDYVKEILKKYDGKIPSKLSIQQFNRHIKNICRKVGFNEPVTYDYIKGGKTYIVTKQKWEMISSHTARRSFATNMYLTGRMKTYEIMAITGHTTEKSFFRYIRITKRNVVDAIAGDNFFRK